MNSLPAFEATTLRPDYYLTNFVTALDWLTMRYAELFSDVEASFITTFKSLPRSSQALLVRLLMRRGDCFRAGAIRYDEIGSIPCAADPLIELRWLDASPRVSAPELFRLLKLDELRRVFPELRASTKKELHARVTARQPEARTLEAWTGDVFDSAYRVLVARLCTQLRVLFFGSFHQQWSAFVVADLGIYQYEHVDLAHDSRVFQCRDDIENFYQLNECHELFEADSPITDVLAAIPSEELANRWLESLRSKLLFDVARRCEREKNVDLALDLYRRSSHVEAKVRALRIRERRGEDALAYDELRAASPIGNARAQQLLDRVRVRVERRLKGVRLTRTKRVRQEAELELQYSAERCKVEERVRRHVHTALAPAFYVENSLFTSLVGLLCWDAIFAPIPGAFFHHFHVGPIDLESPDFRALREEQFDTAIRRLHDGSYAEFIRQMYALKRGIASPFVRWGAIDSALLEVALRCIPAEHLKVCCDWILEDVRENTAGFPDLMQFYPHERRYRMIEVKGPGDRLQDNQKRWFDRCAEHHLPIEVIHVRWVGEVVPMRKRRRPVQLDAFEGAAT